MIEMFIVPVACLIGVFATLLTVGHLYKYTVNKKYEDFAGKVEEELAKMKTVTAEVCADTEELKKFIETAERNTAILSDRINGLQQSVPSARHVFGPKFDNARGV